MPTPISFSVRFVTNKNTTERTRRDLSGMAFKKNIGLTTDLAKVGQVRLMAKPEFIRGTVLDRSGRSKCRKVSGGAKKFIPKRGWRITSDRHRASFVHERKVKAFTFTILHGNMRRGKMVHDTMGCTPIPHGTGFEFAVIGDIEM